MGFLSYHLLKLDLFSIRKGPGHLSSTSFHKERRTSSPNSLWSKGSPMLAAPSLWLELKNTVLLFLGTWGLCSGVQRGVKPQAFGFIPKSCQSCPSSQFVLKVRKEISWTKRRDSKLHKGYSTHECSGSPEGQSKLTLVILFISQSGTVEKSLSGVHQPSSPLCLWVWFGEIMNFIEPGLFFCVVESIWYLQKPGNAHCHGFRSSEEHQNYDIHRSPSPRSLRPVPWDPQMNSIRMFSMEETPVLNL